MPPNDMEILPARATQLKNVICPYCGVGLDKGNVTKEHVVGRGFVPRGSLENQPNLILRACRDCNNRKSDLEDDISAITMQPDVTGRHFGSDARLADNAKRKAKAHSRYARKSVAESKPSLEIKYWLDQFAVMTLNFVGQPQISDERVLELALFHFKACFFFITYNQETNRGQWWKGGYVPIQIVSKLDWGNERSCAFMECTQSWDYRFLMITADENFKMAIRKSLSDDIWSLAVEWNENYRVLAACGESESLNAFVEKLPRLKVDIVSRSANSTLAVRTEKWLKPEADTLFAVPPD